MRRHGSRLDGGSVRVDVHAPRALGFEHQLAQEERVASRALMQVLQGLGAGLDREAAAQQSAGLVESQLGEFGDRHEVFVQQASNRARHGVLVASGEQRRHPEDAHQLIERGGRCLVEQGRIIDHEQVLARVAADHGHELVEAHADIAGGVTRGGGEQGRERAEGHRAQFVERDDRHDRAAPRGESRRDRGGERRLADAARASQKLRASG